MRAADAVTRDGKTHLVVAVTTDWRFYTLGPKSDDPIPREGWTVAHAADDEKHRSWLRTWYHREESERGECINANFEAMQAADAAELRDRNKKIATRMNAVKL